MEYQRLADNPPLTNPVMVINLRGWIDAAGAAQAAVEAITDESNPDPLIEFDDDTFIDYRARRPILELRNGRFDTLEWERLQVLTGQDQTGQDFVLLSGPEPDMRWHRFVEIVGDLATELGVTKAAHLAAYPFAVPHTRPPRLSITTPSVDVLESVSFHRSSVDVPAGAAAALELEMHRRGIPALGIWAQVPHYLPTMNYPAASVALLDGLNEATGLVIDAPALRASVLDARNRIDQLVDENDEYLQMVSQLEQIYEATADDGDETPDTIEDSIELRSGEEIADELERFLRDLDK